METEVKRGRGRPRKVLSPEELNKPKLPRGRPRKYPIDNEPKEKRPRGRPRTRPIVEQTEKRPRGRPRKNREYLQNKKVDAYEDRKNYTEEDFKNSGLDYCRVDFDNIALAEDFQNEQFREVSEKDVIKKAEKEVKNDIKNEKIAREKSSAYVKMKKESQRIIKSGNLVDLYPAKHRKSNILVQLAEKDETPLPEFKLDISRPKTPLSELVVEKSIRSVKTKAMKEKVVVITGATSGMGLAVMLELAKLGHIVIGVGRKATACREAFQTIKNAYPDAKVSFAVADLSLLSQVSVLAEEIADKIYAFKRSCIDVIINCTHSRLNEFELTYENREVMWVTNFMSFVLLTDCLMPLIDRSVDARIITFTNKKAMTKSKLYWQSIQNMPSKYFNKMYDQSRLANLMWALEFDHRNRDNTSLHSYCVESDLNYNTDNVKGFMKKLKSKMFGSKFTEQNFIDGVNTTVYLSLSKGLPRNMVCYQNKQPIYPLNKFALDQDNRNALWRMTELELKIKLRKTQLI